MKPLMFSLLCCTVGLFGSTLAYAEPSLTQLYELPKDTPKAIADVLRTEGVQITKDKGVQAEFWMVDDLAVKPDFLPSLNVYYPFTDGQLLGLLNVPKNAKYVDFRKQEIASGLYTLRYGKQPEDGNHIGTSEVYDFVLATPIALDSNPAKVTDQAAYYEKSAKAAGTSHPAIFLLLPVKKPVTELGFTHDEDQDYWILSVNGSGHEGSKPADVSIRLVVVGEAVE